MRWARALAPLLCLLGAEAAARSVIVSAGPERVAVTVYRDPHRPAAVAPNLRWLNGFALISETRTISLPAGESEIRFEGVAGGILPQSAIVEGFPQGIVERNRDAYLLSPGTLLDRSLGRRVHLRRTSRATGEVSEQEAIVRSGSAGAVVLETEAGFEALRCTGLAETPIYEGVPAELSAAPTLSVRARSAAPVSATVTLSYLATGFDWRANYVAYLAPGGDRLHLFAWLTLASADETSFPNARTQALAGRLNWRGLRAPPSEAPPLRLRCWPQATTSDIAAESETIIVTGARVGRGEMAMQGPPPPPAPPPPPPAPAMVAEQEELGDLKLYRIPEPVTVAARSQKQVAFLDRPSVRVATVYRRRVGLVESGEHVPARRLLVARNRPAEGLGIALPAGALVLFAGGERPLVLGEGSLGDRAVGEEVEIDVGAAPGVLTRVRALSRSGARSDFELVVTNDSPRPAAFEAEFAVPPNLFVSPARLDVRHGMPLWRVTVPANGTATLRYGYVAP